MTKTITITLHLAPEEYREIASEADHLGLQPEQAIKQWIGQRQLLNTRRKELLKAIDDLERLSQTMPNFDATQLISGGREELDDRIPL